MFLTWLFLLLLIISVMPCILVHLRCTRIRHSPYTSSRKTTSQKTFTSEVRTPCTLSHSLTLVTSYTAFAVYVFVEKGQVRNISKLCFLPGLFSSCVHGSFLDIKNGSHLLSQTVARQVPSAAKVLTIVFGMGTGVTP